ncbi:MAG: DUF4177 domain-containing protein [Synergistaceae bacterium]|nr:DUF4177 domain-containing protein [Synergistaceae bacterium]
MRYEYHVDYIHVGHTSPEEMKQKMNEYGEMGWEIISVLFLGRQVNYPYQLIMKREIPE